MDSNKKLYLVAPTFNIPAPANLMIVGNQETGPFVPTLDPSYVFRKEMLRDVLAWLADSSGEGLYLFGPTGCGKSSLICQVAARLAIRFSGAPLAYALDRALTFRAEPATREAIRQIVQRHLGDEAAVLKG